MEIGQKIKSARIAQGLTQEELGKILGVQKSAIAKYENGRVVNIKRSTLQKIAKVLNIRPSELIIGDEPKEAASFHAKVVTDTELMSALKDYYLLSDKNKKMVRDLIRSLKETGV